MRFLRSLFLLAGAVQAASSSWGFDDASAVVGSKKAADRNTIKFSESTTSPETLSLGRTESLKVFLTAKEGSKPGRPHQAFLVLREPSTGLEAPFHMTVKNTGKAVVEIKQSDLPVQFAASTEPLHASVVLGSFGATTQGLASGPVFHVEVTHAADDKPVIYEKPLRYGKLSEIHHIFRADPRQPPSAVSLVFALAVLATLPAIFVGWFALGGNVSHLPTALGKAPLSHVVFFGSLVLMEGVFVLYYHGSWNLFQVLPLAAAVAAAAFLAGPRALGEVQSRRLAGER